VVARFAAFIVLLIVCAIFSIASPGFLGMGNIFDVMRQIALTGVVAIGETFVILTGGIDLSVGSLIALTGVIAASFEARGTNVWLTIVLVPFLGSLIGLGMGSIVTRCRVPAFVVTLGGLEALRGLTLLYTNGTPISPPNGFSNVFTFLGQGFFGPIPFPVIVFLAVTLVANAVLRNSRLGRYIYAIGGNPEAARLSGLAVKSITTLTYAISGLCCGIGGLLLTSRLNSGDPTTATGTELTAIAAVVIGGTSLFGGTGGVIGTLIGATLIGVITNGLTLMNVSAYLQPVVIGSIIVIAVFIDQLAKWRQS
jgi:ribose/xylose/arabinose/galactoside ABC-type transport system permease subunit